jgi:hypothetical protein
MVILGLNVKPSNILFLFGLHHYSSINDTHAYRLCIAVVFQTSSLDNGFVPLLSRRAEGP